MESATGSLRILKLEMPAILRLFLSPISKKNYANRQPLLAALGRRQFSDYADDYAKRNYANNVSEYNTVIGSLTSQRRLKEPWNTGTSTILVIMAQTRLLELISSVLMPHVQ
ncbi:unnamed protein product [Lactuca saligna]|uniref:Uncharacterized protein n=1 Tax=Lactuca saligna TaxID=75948 RepID=A0AA35YSJ4_LACSI|nr:unnamed protein product [Lactuca saligna]